MDVRSPFFQNIAAALVGILFLNPIMVAAAEATLAAANGNIGVTQAGNGVPVVNIATPNGSGLSHNKFNQYNVDQQGLILNNATGKTQSTQLGGIILGNANLNGQAAKLILNEVTGGSPSQLRGYTEVAGQQAHVVVANPNGITCNGCGFINTPRATLTTGKPIIEGGRLDRLQVDGGAISIEGQGLNASNLDQFDLITRSAKINAELHANKLNIIAGANDVEVADLAVSKRAASKTDEPQLAIDSSALGGMYAGAIRLVGTEQGVGVKLAGNMAASAGDIQIDASGKLSMAQTAASDSVRIVADSLEANGKVYAGNNISAQVEGELRNQQSLAARNSISLQAGHMVNQGLIEAGVNSDDSRNNLGDVSIDAQRLRNSGTVAASRALAVAVDELDNSGGTLSGKAQAQFAAEQLDNRQGRLLSQGNLSVQAASIDNSQSGLINGQGSLSVQATGLNNQGGEISTQGSGKITAANLDNRQGKLIGESNLQVAASGSLNNSQGGVISSTKSLLVNAGSLDNSASGTLVSQGTLTATVVGALDNHDGGALISQGKLAVTADTLDNRNAGTLSSQTDLQVATASLTNQGGRIVSEGALNLSSAALDNSQQGTVSGKGSARVEAARLNNSSGGSLVTDGHLLLVAGQVDNSAQGRIAAQGDLNAQIEVLEQRSGELLSQGRLTLTGQRLDNSGAGLLAANQGIDLQVGQINNRGGEISSRAAVAITTADLDNSAAGTIIGDAGLRLTVERLLNSALGRLLGRDALVVRGASLDNSAGGTLSSQQNLDIALSGDLNNSDDGALVSEGLLSLNARALNNQAGAVSSAGNLAVNATGRLDNQGGKLVTDSELQLASNRLDNSAGTISGKTATRVQTGDLINQGGRLVAGTSLTLSAAKVDNRNQGLLAASSALTATVTELDQRGAGQLVSEGALTLDMRQGVLNNSEQGLLAASGPLLLNNLKSVNNSQGGEISSNRSFVLVADSLNNQGGRVISGQALMLRINQSLINSLNGVLSGAEALNLQAASADNAGGTVASRGDMEVEVAGALNNASAGTLSAGGQLIVMSASLDNSAQGLIASAGNLKLETGAIDNRSGQLLSEKELQVTTGDVDNRNGVISSEQALQLDAARVDNQAGLINSGTSLALTATTLDSSNQGEVSAQQDLILSVNQLIQQQGRLISGARLSLDLHDGSLDNRGGLISAYGPLTLANLLALDNRGGELSSNASFLLKADRIDNGEQGRIISAGALGLNAADIRNTGEGLLSGWQGLEVTGGSLDNRGKGTLSSRNGALSVELSGALNNSAEGALASQGDLRVKAASLNNSDKGILSTEGRLDLTLAGDLDNHDQGLLSAEGAVAIQVRDVNNGAGQIVGHSLLLTGHNLDNSAGQLSSDTSLNLILQGLLINTQQAQLASGADLLLRAGTVDNRGGKLISQGLLDVLAGSLNNSTGGTLAARNAVDIALTGALDNSQNGLIYSLDDQLNIQGQSLDNNAGTLQSKKDLSLKIDGALANQQGSVTSDTGNVEVQAASLSNRTGGNLYSILGWLKLTVTGLFDNTDGVTQARSLDIRSGSLSNAAGHLSATHGDNHIVAGAFNNQGGGLYAGQLLDLTADSLDNRNGQVAAGAIDLGLGGALNNGNGIIESGSTLSIASTSLLNSGGKLRALGNQGSTLIRSGTLDNRSGVLESANTHLKLELDNLLNAGGRIQHVGTGNLELASAQAMAAGGTLATNGQLSISAQSWVNSGILQAARLLLNVKQFSQTSTGQLLASESLIASGNTWNNDGLLASDGTLTLTLSGAYSGSGKLSSLGDLNLTASDLDLASAGRVTGGALTTITVADQLTNHGKLTSAGDFNLTAGALTNYGTLGGGQNLRITTPTLLNAQGLIFSGEDMVLRANRFTNWYADVFSLGSLLVAKDAANNWSALLDNVSGTIESRGDMQLRAASLQNRKEKFELAERLVSGDISYECKEHDGQCAGSHYDIMYYVDEVLERTVLSDSPAANIVSGANLLIRGNSFSNSHSMVSAAGNISIDVDNFSNEGAASSTVVRSRMFRTPVDSESGGRFWDMVEPGGALSEYAKYNSQYVYEYWEYRREDKGATQYKATNSRDEQKTDQLNPYYNPAAAQPVPSRILGYSLVSSTETVTPTGTASNAVIQAGGNLSTKANESFNNSVLTSNTNVGLGASKVASTSASGTGKNFVVVLNAQLPPDLRQQQVNPLTLPGFTIPQGSNGLFRLSGQTAQSAQQTAVQHNVQDLTLDGSGITLGDSEQLVGYVSGPGQVVGNQTVGHAPGMPVKTVGSIAGVQQAQALSLANKPAATHRYLIETNPELTNLRSFMGSDYLLGLLGYDLDQVSKRLGDGLYEQRLMRESIVARTGQRFLAGLTSDEAMFKYLMDNAVASKQALNLSLGISLTAQQVAALTHDIVWLEEHEVMGQKVLVPVLYLAQAKGRLAANGALLQGKDVSLISGTDLSNQGTLRATENLEMKARNIGNAGGLIEAGKRLDLLATDNIRNAQGGIIAGRDVSLLTERGDISNERTVSRHSASYGSKTWTNDYVDRAARIEAGSLLNLSAGRDITNVGSVLQSRGDIELDAGRDINLAAATELHQVIKGKKYNDEHLRQIGGEVVASNDVYASAGRDITATASKLSAGRDLDLMAVRDVAIVSAANEDHFFSKSKKVTKSTDQITQVGSNVEAGRDLSIRAGQDLTLLASKVKGGQDVDLDAQRDLNVLSAKDEKASFYFKKSKGSFGRSKSEQKESYDSTNVASVVEAGRDLTLNTSKSSDGGLNIDGGRDVTIIGSQLKAGGDLMVGATRDIAVLSGVEEHGSYSKKTKSGFLGLSSSGKSQLKTTATQVSSELQAGNDVVVAAGNDVRLRASTASAGNDVELRSGLVTETGDINLVAANDTAYSRSEEYKKKFGLSSSDAFGLAVGTPSWGGDIAISNAKKSGSEAISSTSVGSQVTADRDATLKSSRDINIIGSGVSAGRNVLLDAGRDVNIVAGSNSQQNTQWEQDKTLGMQQDFDRNGFSTFVGQETLKERQLDSTQTAAASQIDAGLDLDIRAGRDVVQQGSDLSAGYDINVQAGRDILIDAADERSVSTLTESQERTGTTTQVNHNAGSTMDALQGAGKGENGVSQVSSTLKAADSFSQFLAGPTFDGHAGTTSQSQTSTSIVDSNRVSTLNAGNDVNLQAGRDVVVRGGQVEAGRDINVKGRDITFDVARGTQTQDSEQTQGKGGVVGGTTGGFKAGVGGSHGTATQEGSQGTSTGAYLDAGRDINLEASRDLGLIGTQAQSGRDINLDAGNDLYVGAAGNPHVQDDKRRSGGGEVGLTFGSDGIGVYASVNIGRGELDRDGTQQQEAYLYAGRDLSFESGRDTTIAGARLEGENVHGDVGRNLTVSSVPDTGKVKGKEYDASATVTVGYGASVSGSVGYGQTTGKTDWVDSQTAIIGRDRVDIRTEDHTQIDGAVIASQTGNLKLDTDTLGFRDIEGVDNEQGYYLNAGGSYNFSGGGGQQDKSQVGKGESGANGWSVEGYEYSKDRENIARATVGSGEIIVRSDAETGEDSTAGLNRDVDKSYEITKDEESRTDLYVSESSVSAIGDPVGTYNQWKEQISSYKDSPKRAAEQAAALLEKSSQVVDLLWDEIQAQQVKVDSVPAGVRAKFGDEMALAIAKNMVRNGYSEDALLKLDAGDMQAIGVMIKAFNDFDYAVATCQASGQCAVTSGEAGNPGEKSYQYVDENGQIKRVRLSGLEVSTSGEKLLDKTAALMKYLDHLPKEQAQIVLLGVQAAMGPAKAAVGLAGNMLLAQLYGEQIEKYKNDAALSIADVLTRKDNDQLANSQEALAALNAAGQISQEGDIYVKGAVGLLDIALGSVAGIGGKVSGRAISTSAKGALSPIDVYVDLTSGRSGHILANHRAGAGKPGKTEFPSSWSDNRIVHQVSDVATDPTLIRKVDSRGTPYVSGARDGIDIRVTFFPDNHPRAGQISSAYPINVLANPRPQ